MANSAFHVFHMSEVLSGEKHPRQRRHLDRGFEAPRNSLDVLDAAIDVSRSGSFKPEDIPFGYEILNPALAASGPQSKWDGTSNDVGNDFSGRKETRRQGPNIVARLMGLETLPDELPTVQPRNSLQGMPIYGCSKPPVGNPSMSRQSSQDAALSSWQRPPRPRHVQRAPLNVEEDRVLAPVLPFRDHPQEELLQKFKKDFEAKQQAALAKERDRCGTSQVLEEMNRELDEKKQRVRATLDKARTALSQGVLAELKRQLNGQENFDESKEFLEAMEFLQCNEDLIFHFLQHKPHSTLSDENSNDTTPVANLKSMKKRILGGLVPASSRESKERKREGFSPRAFARLFRDPRKRSDNKQQPCTPPLSGTTTPSSASLQPAIERCNSAGFYRRPSAEFTRDSAPDEAHLRTLNFSNLRAQSCPASPRMHGKPLSGGCEVRSSLKKNGARAVAAEMKERLRQTVHRDETEEVGYVKNLSPERPQGWFGDSEDITQEIAKSTRDQDSRKNNFILTKTFPTGKRVAIQRVDMEDATCTSGGEELSLPSAKMDKQNVTRSGISLPCSPHLGERTLDNVPVSSMRTRPKRASEQKPTIPRTTEQADSPATLIAVAKKTIASTESPRRINDSPRSSKSEFTEKSMRRSASVNENAIRSYHLQQKGDACPVPTSKGNCHDHSENDPALNFTRSRSVPNVAILRDRGQCTNEAKKGTAKTTSEVSKHGKGQNSEKRKGFFSVGRKKGRAPVESISSGHSLFFPSSGPVFARVAALAESCVSQGNTLSDADSAVNVTVHVRSRRSTDRSKKGREWPKEANASSELKNFVECFEPWFAHESDVISESSADSDANPNDEEFLDALSQLTPLIDQKSTAIEKQITGELLGTVSTITSQAHEVQGDRRTSEHLPPPWRTAEGIIHELTSDEGQDSNSDKNGHPSPVSVLDPPFDEESPSSLEFDGINNGLQDLQVRVQLLKAEGRERRRDDPIIQAPAPPCESRALISSLQNTKIVPKKIPFLTPKCERNTFDSPQVLLSDVRPNPAGREEDFRFANDLLVASGFATHEERNIGRWHSATQPISHHFLRKVDASYKEKDAHGSTSSRRFLFDAINEILVSKLGPKCYAPWLQMPGYNPTALRTGRRLVEDVCNEIHKRQFPVRCEDSHNDYLESLVADDLKNSTSWMGLHHDMDRICHQLEKAIFTDLIQEICGDLRNLHVQ